MKTLIVIAALCLYSHSHATDYQVFTTTFLPPIEIRDYPVDIYYLNQPELILARLGHFQPNNRKSAKQQALQTLNTPEGKTMLSELERSFQGIFGAWSHNISFLPAILVNDRFLLYGVYDLEEANDRVKRWLDQEARGEGE